jgi:hypothetical protein
MKEEVGSLQPLQRRKEESERTSAFSFSTPFPTSIFLLSPPHYHTARLGA